MLPRTLATMPSFVDHIIVVDDCSSDGTAELARCWEDDRVHVVEHQQNAGVGAAIVSGYQAALELACDATAVMAGDGQMDPVDLPGLLDAFVDSRADYVKGDRSLHPAVALTMPPKRLLGTTVLAWATRLSSGIPGLRDTQCGYTVISRSCLEALPLDLLFPRYGFPNDILNRIGEMGGKVVQHPIRPVYAGEASGLRVRRVVGPISGILARGMWRRLRSSATKIHLVALAAVVAGLLTGIVAAPSQAEEAAEGPDPRVERVLEVVQLIETQHYQLVDPAWLIYNAIQGMVRTLDHHSRFMPAQAYRVWQGRIHGNTSRVGLELLISAHGVGISRVVPGSPADRAGITSRDLLVAVDDLLVERLGVSEIKARLRGEEGTEVAVVIERLDGTRETMTLVRERIRPVPVTSELLDGVLHVRCHVFQDNAAQMMRDAISEAEAASDVRGIILDFRGNLGGLLEQAVAMAELFLPEGAVVVSLERRGDVDRVHQTTGQPLFDHPMVVLVDGRSASASELFAGAMQDHGRAAIVGETTFGKGSVQTTYTLPDGSGLKITTSLYFTPSHRSIDEAGIHPDVEVWERPSRIDDPQLSTALTVVEARMDARRGQTVLTDEPSDR